MTTVKDMTAASAWKTDGEEIVPVPDKLDGYCTVHGTDSAVDHPAYYNRGSMEVIDIMKAVIACHPVIDPWQAALVGQVTKYLCRFGEKGDAVQDLDKTLWYLKDLRDEVAKSEEDER